MGEQDPDSDSTPDSTFAIPHRPQRRYPRSGGVRYEGETTFLLSPDDRSPDDLADRVEEILGEDPYTFGDWFDLPAPVYLVRDDDRDTTFRVVVRSGVVELHVLPDTRSAGLRAFYRRLAAASECDWFVSCESSPS